MIRRLIIFIATGAYAGYVPLAPGTAGAVVGLVVGRFLFAPLWQRSPTAFLMMFGVAFIVGCVVAGSAEKTLAEHDSPHIVLDEIFGMMATMFLNPISWGCMIGGFALFRLFDIIKPWPAHRLEHAPGGLGVMLDDLAAGIYANLVLQIVRRVV
jgi:phosphatidylglycerophosphatase A